LGPLPKSWENWYRPAVMADEAPLAASPPPRPRAAAWPRLAGSSAAMQRLEQAIARVGGYECSVLISGETGCGKEEVARAIHIAGSRSRGPFVAVNCGGVVATLAESLLFGHVRGAFTGADEAASGAFRAAHGGTLFLDEVGEMPLDLQPKLLRALQQREVAPVGSNVPVAVDVQVVAATNRDLPAEVTAGRFREDLLYRLNTVHLTVPPLRERADEIPYFIAHFARWYAERFEMPQWMPEPGVMDRLVRHPWPGNVRELAQLVQRIYIFGDRIDEVIDESLRPPRIAAGRAEASSAAGPAAATADPVLPVCNLVELRKIAVRQALRESGGRMAEAAAILGVSRNTMTKIAGEACPDRAARQGLRRPGVKPR